MDHHLQINPVDEDWPPGTFDFGFDDNILELIEELIEKRPDLEDILNSDEPISILPRAVYTPGSPEDTREKRYTPRTGPWCGHETILRSWASATSSKCQDCGHTARWLWACTADTPDHSPFVPNPEPITRDVSILAPWMQQAIAKGEYSDAQVEKMLDQKVNVLEQAASERRRVAQQERKEPTGSPDVVGVSPPPASDSQQQPVHPDESASDKVVTPIPPETHTRPISCRMLACPNCKPRFLEHAWGRLNAIVNEPYVAPPQIPEYLDRRISDAATLQSMHEHCRSWNWNSDFQEWWDKVREAGGYDILPMLLMAETIRSNQADFIEFVGHMVLCCRITYSQMCQCLYLINPQAFTRLVPFLGADVCIIRCLHSAPVVEVDSQPEKED